MKRPSIQNTVAVGASFLTIVAPKFCCWSSALAAISGGASYFAWVYPMRPWLFALSFLSVGYSLYKAYLPAGRHGRPKKETTDGCVCNQNKTSFLKSKLFAWLVAIFVSVMFFISYFIQ